MRPIFRPTIAAYVPPSELKDENWCYVDGCNDPIKYVIEWYGLNQDGKNPEVADERKVCGNFEHIVQASEHDEYGGFPDGIVDVKTCDIEHPGLTKRVIDAMKHIPIKH